ncbi:SDR family oxidoreductase [Nocardia salmonicida]|uniref:SDR family oxidoreductase n=1 Tax=Nocardia salmonicida TaxID=53431 RepID=UPI0007A395E0|nr:SDR family oxidoreductase [Nocardia salmonicida]
MTTSTRPSARPFRPLAGRGALVTGGSRGIGRAITSRLAADGATVVFTYATSSDAPDTLVAENTESNGQVSAVQVDLADPDQVTAGFAAADEVFRTASVGLDIFVANAGVFTSALLAEATVDEWDRVMAVNARGTFLTLAQATPRLRDNGRVVTVSTVGTHWPSPGEGIYAASKAAVEQLTRVASRELGHRGITANTISLGPTDTELLRASAQPGAVEGAAAMTALGRIGQPTDIADLVALLVHPDSRWVTGQNIRADGGLT